MFSLEQFTFFLSCIACLASFYAFLQNRKLQKEANDLQKVTADLSKKQLALLKKEELERAKTEISVGLYNEGSNRSSFYIMNKGCCEARLVSFELILDKPEDNPLIMSQFEDRIPIPILDSGDQVKLAASISIGKPHSYRGLTTWKNPDGTTGEKEFYAALQ